MKKVLKYLYQYRKRHFEVWNYLWLHSEDGITHFTYLDVCAKFKVPKSTLARILQLENEWNEEDQILTKVERVSNGHKVTFFEEVLKKPVKKQPTVQNSAPRPENPLKPVTNHVHEYLKGKYDTLGIVYPKFDTEKPKVTNLIKKVEEMLKEQGKSTLPEDIQDSTILFIDKIPEWWWQNAFTIGHFTRNFEKIYNQIKINVNGGKSKRLATYQQAAKEADGIDYSQLAGRG